MKNPFLDKYESSGQSQSNDMLEASHKNHSYKQDVDQDIDELNMNNKCTPNKSIVYDRFFKGF